MDVFLATIVPMLVLFGCIIIGFLLKKFRILPSDSATVMSKLETYVFVPALTLSTFMTNCSFATLKEYIDIIFYSCIALAVAMGIAIPLSCLFVRKKSYKRSIYQYALTFANCGFMGNAIIMAVMPGTEGLFKYLLFTLPLSVGIYSWGLYILIPRHSNDGGFLKRFFNPSIIAMLVGIVLGLTGTSKYIPSFLVQIVDSTKVCMAPVAMILTGFVIAGYPFKGLLNDKKVYIATGLRLLILPTVILVFLRICGASDLVMRLAFFAFATPLGLNTVVFPAAYGGDSHTGASMAAISHTLCVITIPIMYTLLEVVLKYV
jgi:predicted permease